jgi:hypothetical protein
MFWRIYIIFLPKINPNIMIQATNITVNEIEDFPFSGCTALTTINVHPDNPYFSSENGVLFNKKKTELLFYPMSKEGDYEIPASVSKIKRWAFYFCDGLCSIVFPNSLIEIEDNFYGCSGLTSVIIPASVIKIEINDWEGAFLGALSLTTITVSLENPVYASEKGILFNKDKTELLLCPRAWQGEFTIPISVEKIHEDAFFRCNNLTSIDVEPDTLFFASERGVLFNKDKTVLICYPEGKEGDSVLPNSVVSLGKHAFNGNAKLTSIIISNSVVEIDSHAFSQCYNLKNVSIPNSVTKIGNSAFRHCIKLPTVSIPQSVIEIGERAFHSCTGLTTLTIANLTVKVGDNALDECNALGDISWDEVNEFFTVLKEK